MARADAVALIIDTACYFEAVAEAIASAERSVFIVGWDVHSRTPLRRAGGHDETLASVIEAALRDNPQLCIRLLAWDFSLLYAFERELTALLRARVRHHRLSIVMAADHPIGGSHHQKFVVIDDALAFSGGIDLTLARWDRPDHRAHCKGRTLPGGQSYPPFHDVQIAVTGQAAERLGALARERWHGATGERLPAPTRGLARLPTSLAADLCDVSVAISRSAPRREGAPACLEVRELFLATIAAARRHIYIENQYLTAPCIRDALSRRLREPDGPEVLIVTPRTESGWLEERTLGGLRRLWLGVLEAADRHGHLRVLCPLAPDDRAVTVYVHAKVMCVDDEWLRVGSANLTGRSMGLDTECDVTVLARGNASTQRSIRALRDRLLAHHLGVEPRRLTEAMASGTSLLRVVDDLCAETGRMAPVRACDCAAEPLLKGAVLDPDEAMDRALARAALPEELHAHAGRKAYRALLYLATLLVLAAVWTWSPLRDWVEPARAATLLASLDDTLWGPAVYVVLIAAATLCMVPLMALLVAGTLIFGPAVGAITGLLGGLLSAAIGYRLGKSLLGSVVRRRYGGTVHRLAAAFSKGGLLAVLAIRLLPIAPFAIVNLAAGTAGVRFRDYLVGTALGLVPGLIGLSIAADRIVAAVRSPRPITLLVAAVVVALVVVAALALHRFLTRAT